ncbi:MAG: zinc-ribbon domain-containing protein, partial [Thermoplasmata archaeon]
MAEKDSDKRSAEDDETSKEIEEKDIDDLLGELNTIMDDNSLESNIHRKEDHKIKKEEDSADTDDEETEEEDSEEEEEEVGEDEEEEESEEENEEEEKEEKEEATEDADSQEGSDTGKEGVFECPNCGKELPASAMECTGCGGEFEEAKEGETEESAEKDEEKEEEAAEVSAEEKKEEGKCPECGAPIAEGASSCSKCGATISAKSKEDEADKTVTTTEEGTFECPNCGTVLPASATTCSGCGVEFEEEVEQEGQEASEASEGEESAEATSSEEATECENCRNTIPDDANICPHCGAAFAEQAEAVTCGSCGKYIEASLTQCPYCNAEFEADAETEEEEEEEEEKPESLTSRGISPETEKQRRRGLTNGNGFVNGLAGVRKGRAGRRYVQKRKPSRVPAIVLGITIIGMLIAIAVLSVVLFFSGPGMTIDGRLDDWEDYSVIVDSTSTIGGEPAASGINIAETGIMEKGNTLYFYVKTAGDIFKPAGTDSADAVYIFIDKDPIDATPNNGFLIHDIYADFRISISGWEGTAHSSVIEFYMGGPENQTNWNSFGAGTGVSAGVSGSVLEIGVPKASFANLQEFSKLRFVVVTKGADGSTDMLDSPGNLEGLSLAVQQSSNAPAVISSSPAEILSFTIRNNGRDTSISGITISVSGDISAISKATLTAGSATAEGQKEGNTLKFTFSSPISIGADKSITGSVSIEFDSTSASGKAIKAEVVSLSSSAHIAYSISGTTKASYLTSAPSGITIDGAFADWQNIQAYPDGFEADIPARLDIVETKNTTQSGSLFLYAKVNSPVMLEGVEVPSLPGKRPAEGGTPGGALPVLDSCDWVLVYLETNSSSATYQSIGGIRADKRLVVFGLNGKVIASRLEQYGQTGWEAVSGSSMPAAVGGSELEMAVSMTGLGNPAQPVRAVFATNGWEKKGDMTEVHTVYGGHREGSRSGGVFGLTETSIADFADGVMVKTVVVNDRYTSTTKGAIRLENSTISYGGLNASDVDANGDLTVSNTRNWSGIYYFRHLKIANGGNITANGYMTVIKIYAEVIEIEAGGTIYLAGKGGEGGNGGTGDGGDGYSGQDGSDGSGPAGPSLNGAADGGGGGGGVVNSDNYGGWGGGGGAYNGSGGDGGKGAKDGTLGNDGSNGYYGRGGTTYAASLTPKPGSGGGGGSAGQKAGGGSGNDGSYGGAGGGAIVLNAWNIFVNGRIKANGMNGGTGNQGDMPGGGGGGGSGGCILIQGCNVSIGSNAELNASGGNGGDGGD